MEISPIPGIRALPTVKPAKNSLQLSAVFEIENAFGPQQDTFSHGGRKLPGGHDDDAVEQEEAARSTEESSASENGSTVNLIA
jgi:hypothetical protein